VDKSTVTRLRVQLAGSDYTLRGHASVEHLQAVAEMVQTIMSDIRQSNPQLDEKRIAMLTALNVADRFLNLQTEFEEMVQLLDEQTTGKKSREE